MPPRSIQNQLKVWHIGVKVPINKVVQHHSVSDQKGAKRKESVRSAGQSFQGWGLWNWTGVGQWWTCNPLLLCTFCNGGVNEINHDMLILDSIYKTNKCRLSFLDVVGSTALHTTLSAAFDFMKNEESYKTSVGCLYKLFHTYAQPKFFAVDREFYLISALQYHFPEDSILLCVAYWEEDHQELKGQSWQRSGTIHEILGSGKKRFIYKFLWNL